MLERLLIPPDSSEAAKGKAVSDFSFALRGWLIGLAIAAPVGPIGVLCIRRTLTNGRLIGFVSGLGAATADMFYGAIAAFGITALQNLLLRQQAWLRVLGGAFLIYLGVRTFLMRPAMDTAQSGKPQGVLQAYVSTLGLTLTNPATILSFTVIFAGLRLGETEGSYLSAASMVAGVFLGSATWWLGLAFLVGLLRERLAHQRMLWVNRLAGIVILGFGLAAIVLR